MLTGISLHVIAYLHRTTLFCVFRTERPLSRAIRRHSVRPGWPFLVILYDIPLSCLGFLILCRPRFYSVRSLEHFTSMAVSHARI